MSDPHFTVFTDGSCGSGEGGDIGGWCAIIVSATARKMLYGCTYATTISRCELTPIIEALRHIKNVTDNAKGIRVRVISDSEYTIKTLCGENAEHKNNDLWLGLHDVARGLEVQYCWRSRNTHEYMTTCDAVCSLLRHQTRSYMTTMVGDWRLAGDLLQDVSLPEESSLFQELG